MSGINKLSNMSSLARRQDDLDDQETQETSSRNQNETLNTGIRKSPITAFGENSSFESQNDDGTEETDISTEETDISSETTDAAKISDSVSKLQSDEFDEQVSGIVELIEIVELDELPTILEENGIEDIALLELVTNKEALEALPVLVNQDSSIEERVEATFTLSRAIGDIAPDKVKEFVAPYLKDLPNAEVVVDSLFTLLDNEAGIDDKAKASLTLVEELNEIAPEKVQNILGPLAEDSPDIKRVIDAAITLSDDDANNSDKVEALVELVDAAGELAPDKVEAFISQYIPDIQGGEEILNAVSTYLDPDASNIDKLQASLDLFDTINEHYGDSFGRLKALDSLSSSLQAGLTLVDPDASIEEKAQAIADLAESVPEIKDDLPNFFRKNDIENADEILESFDSSIINQTLPEEVQSQIKPEVAQELTQEDAEKLAKLYESEELRGDINKILSSADDPEALKGLLNSVDSIEDVASQKQFLEVAGKLGPAEQKTVAKIAAELDPKSLKFFLNVAGSIDDALLKETLGLIDEIDPKILNAGIGALDALFSKGGVKLTSEIAGKIFKAIGKMVPVLGAGLAAADVWQFGQTALNSDLPPDLRFLAAQGVKLSTADVLLSVLEPIVGPLTGGAGFAVDAGIAFATLGIDIILSDQQAKFEADPDGYETPDWLTALNVAGTAALAPSNPTVIAEFITIYGPTGAYEAVETAIEFGGELAREAIPMLKDLAEQGVKAAAEKLVDIALNPEEYGEAAVDFAFDTIVNLNELSTDILISLTEGLASLGEAGLERLAWIANNPGEAADAAKEALVNLASQGGELAQAAYDEIVGLGDQGLESAEQVVNNLVDLGEEGVDTLEYIASHPDEVFSSVSNLAIDGLKNIAEAIGNGVNAASDALNNLADEGYERARDALNELEAAWQAVRNAPGNIWRAVT